MTIASEHIVELQNIKKTYPKGVVALKDVNLTIPKQEIIGIVGANGSGKSTLLKLIAGNLNPEQGSIKVFQLDIQKNAEQLKKQTSYISQDRALDPEMTGKELLRYFSALYGLTGSTARKRYAELIDIFQLTDFIERRVKSYSGGQAQRLHLAIGIIHQPKLLLLDEPTSALDPSGKEFFWDFISSYQQQGNTIIVVSHELDNIRRYCSRVLLMDKGKLIANEIPDDIIQTYATPVLHIKSSTNLSKKHNLSQLLEQAIPSATIQLKGQSVRFEIKQDANDDKSKILASVLQVFQTQQYAIVECRWEEAGLENAYFNMTGHTISSLPAFKNNNKGQRKRR
jgi:ABC-2 type transport system ATP-binding protein